MVVDSEFASYFMLTALVVMLTVVVSKHFDARDSRQVSAGDSFAFTDSRQTTWLHTVKIPHDDALNKVQAVLGNMSRAAEVVLHALLDPRLKDGLAAVVMDADYRNLGRHVPDFPKSNLDRHVLTKMLKKYIGNVLEREDMFREFVCTRCNKDLNKGDKWTNDGVRALTGVLGLHSNWLVCGIHWLFGGILRRIFGTAFDRIDDADFLMSQLVGKSCDGALFVHSNGEINGAHVNIKLVSDLGVMKSKGPVGTRHASACAAAEWLLEHGVAGIVAVRSEGGSVTLLIAEGDEIKAYEVAP